MYYLVEKLNYRCDMMPMFASICLSNFASFLHPLGLVTRNDALRVLF